MLGPDYQLDNRQLCAVLICTLLELFLERPPPNGCLNSMEFLGQVRDSADQETGRVLGKLFSVSVLTLNLVQKLERQSFSQHEHQFRNKE